MKTIEKIVSKIFEEKVSIAEFMAAYLSVMVVRLFVEQFIAVAPKFSFFEIMVEFTHNILFFGISFLLIWLYLSLILKVNPQKIAGLFMWALLLIIIPPLLDILKTGGGVYWSFYILSDSKTLFGQFFGFFGNLPPGIVYFGTKIVFTIAILLLTIVAYIRTKSLFKAFISFLGTYLILFLMGAFPSIFYYILAYFSQNALNDVRSFQIAQFFGSPGVILGLSAPSLSFAFAYKLGIIYYPILIVLLFGLFLWSDRRRLVEIVKNARMPQLVYHSGLMFIGIGLAALDFPQNVTMDIFSVFSVLTLLIGVCLSWIASVFVNDIYDVNIDHLTNPSRPLQKGVFGVSQYWQMGIAVFFLALLAGAVLGPPFLVLFLVYQVLAWMYSARPYRLKKYPFVASFVSALASLIILFLGYILINPSQDIHALSSRIVFLLLIAYTISIPIKDLKDIAGDRADRVWTWPVILGEKRGRLAIGTGFFISYMLSVFFLNEARLFLWALIFGVLTFLAVNSKKISPRNIFWWVLGFAFIYGMILVKIVFL